MGVHQDNRSGEIKLIEGEYRMISLNTPVNHGELLFPLSYMISFTDALLVQSLCHPTDVRCWQ